MCNFSARKSNWYLERTLQVRFLKTPCEVYIYIYIYVKSLLLCVLGQLLRGWWWSRGSNSVSSESVKFQDPVSLPQWENQHTVNIKFFSNLDAQSILPIEKIIGLWKQASTTRSLRHWTSRWRKSLGEKLPPRLHITCIHNTNHFYRIALEAWQKGNLKVSKGN